MDSKNFEILLNEECFETSGGIFGVDDAIFWAVVGGCFVAGVGAGVAAGINRKNRNS